MDMREYYSRNQQFKQDFEQGKLNFNPSDKDNLDSWIQRTGPERAAQMYGEWARQFASEIDRGTKIKVKDEKSDAVGAAAIANAGANKALSLNGGVPTTGGYYAKDAFGDNVKRLNKLINDSAFFNAVGKRLGYDGLDAETIEYAQSVKNRNDEIYQFYAGYDSENSYLADKKKNDGINAFINSDVGKEICSDGEIPSTYTLENRIGNQEAYHQQTIKWLKENGLTEEEINNTMIWDDEAVDEKGKKGAWRYVNNYAEFLEVAGYLSNEKAKQNGIVSLEIYEGLKTALGYAKDEQKLRRDQWRKITEDERQAEVEADIQQDIGVAGAEAVRMVNKYLDPDNDEVTQSQIKSHLKSKGLNDTKIRNIIEYAEGERNKKKLEKLIADKSEKVNLWENIWDFTVANISPTGWLFGGASAIVDTVGEMFTKDSKDGFNTGYNHAYAGGNYLNQYVTALNQSVAQDIKSDVGKDVYSFSASTVQNAAIIAAAYGAAAIATKYTGGAAGGAAFSAAGATVAKVMSAAMFAISAGGSTMTDAVTRGATPEQAFSLGAVTAAIEVATEKLPFDNLMKIINERDVAENAIKVICKDAIEQMSTEAGEEFVSQFAGYIADIAIMADKSELKMLYDNYVAQGIDPGEASARVLMDAMGGLFTAALGGAFSGFFLGGGTSVITQTINLVGEIKLGKKVNAAGLTDFVYDYAKQHKFDGEGVSDNIQTILVKEKRSDADIGRVYRAVTKVAADNLQAEVNREYGVTETTPFTTAIAKTLLEMELNAAEQTYASSDEGVALVQRMATTQAFADATKLRVALKADGAANSTTTGTTSDTASTAPTLPLSGLNGAQSANTDVDDQPGATGAVDAAGSIDNPSTTGYNNTRGDSYAPTDEFRNLQAESQRMSDEEWQFYLRGGTNETVRGRVFAILKRQMDAWRNSGGANNGLLTLEAKGKQFNIYENVDSALFHDVFELARKYLRNGELVDLHNIETTEDGTGYDDCYNYLSDDGLSGFSITPDGDLISVFNVSGRPGFLRAISSVVKEKVKTLDCYVSPNQNLMEMYARTFGFEAASLMDYNMEFDHDNIAENHGKPQIAFMVNTESDVETKHFSAEEYDAAVEYRDKYVDSVNVGAYDDSASPFDEPDLTDTSDVDIYDRTAQQMMGKPFVYTKQHERVEQVAKKLGRNLYWDCSFGNGYIDANGDIHLAPDTDNPISKVFKHELTHFLQRAEQSYNRFANAVMDSQIFRNWVKSKGYTSAEAFVNHIIETYQAAEQERRQTNPNAPEVTIDEGKAYQEMLADFVGENLFGDESNITEQLLNALEEQPRLSFVETIKQWLTKIKNALKGTKEGDVIAKFEQNFIDAYKAAQKTVNSEGTKNTAQADGQYDIGVLDNGNTYVIASRKVIKGTTLKDQRADITTFFKKLLQNKSSIDIPTVEGDVLTITMAQTEDKARDNYKYVAGAPVKMSDDEFRVKLNIEAHIDEIAETSIPDKRLPTKDTKNHSFAKDGFTYRTAYFEDFDGQYYKIQFSVGHNGTVATVYNVGKIKGSAPSSAKLIAVVGSKALDGSLPNVIIPNPEQNVNKNTTTDSANSDEQYSITIETEYMQAIKERDLKTAWRLVKEAAERAMPDSKARGANGKLDIAYHGTEMKKIFYVFDKKRQGQTDSGTYGRGYYFTNDYSYAELYSEEDPDNEPRAFFLNIVNPFEISHPAAPAREIADKLMSLGVNVGFDYRDMTAQQFAKHFGNQRFSDVLQELGYDGIIVDNGYDYVVFDQNQMKSAELITYDDNGNIIPLEQRFDYGSNDVRYSIDVDNEVSNIKINMSDDQRYEVLKNKKIQPQNIEVDKEFDISFEYLENNIKSIIEKPLINKLRELGYLRKYRTSVIDVDFEFTGGGLRKSLNSQIMDYGGSFADLAKVVLNLQMLLDNSILLEIHSDKGKGTSRENPQLIQTYVLLGAFREGNVIKPVQFEVKQYVDNSNRLYLAVALTKIETGVMGNTILDENQASTYLLPVSVISISDLVTQINPQDAKLLKYIPNQFLSERQIEAKNIEIAKDAEKYSDSKKGRYSISMETATDLLEQYEQGKITKEEYLSRIARQKVSNPSQIASLTPDDASTTPEFPEITDDGKQDGNSSFYTNVKEKAKFIKDTVKDMVTDDSFIKHYATITNKETLAKAAKKLDEGGAAFVHEWAAKDEKNMTAEDISVGIILIERYQVEGNHAAVINVMRKMRKAGTIAGQAVQSFAILGRLDPTSMQMYMQKELDEAYEAMVQGKTSKWISENKGKFELTEEEMDYIRRRALQASRATDSRAKDIAIAEILAMVSNKIPPDKGMALKSYMRISMLFNLKTQVRNVLGNVSMVPAHWASDLVGTAIDTITAKFTGYRTKGINIVTRKNSEAFIQGARETVEDYRLGIDTRQDLDRFDVGTGKAFNDQHSGIASILNPISRTLNRIDRLNSFFLELGDRPFYEYWFTNSLENQMRLNGVTEATAEMIEIAEQEALTRVWQDTNAFTKSVTSIKKILNGINVRGYGLGDVFIKFVKTPANLTKAMVDFSPIGLANGLLDIVKLNRSLRTGVGNSKLLQNKMVKNLSNGIVGTLLYLAFYALAAGLVKGVTVSGAPDDDDDVNAFNKEVLGRYPYTISVGDYSFSYDWMSPVGSMMAATVAVVDASEQKDKDMLTVSGDAINAAAEALFDQSFMQSLQEIFTNRDGKLSGVGQAIIDEPSVLIPQLISQFASSLDEYQRETYQKDDSWQTMWNNIAYKLPWLRETLEPKLDALGRETANPRGDFFNSFINPANTYVSNSTETAEEIYRLYESTGEASVMYPKAPRSVTYKGKSSTLTIKERNRYQKTLGTISDRNIATLIQLEAYKEMDDTDRVKTIEGVYEYARAIAKAAYLNDESTISTKHKKIKLLEEEGVISAVEYLLLTETADDDGNGYLTDAELNRGLQAYIEDSRMRKLVKKLYRAKATDIDSIAEKINN